MYAIAAGCDIRDFGTMSPAPDDRILAEKFLDDLINRVKDVPDIRASVDGLKRDADIWRKDHDTVMGAQAVAGLLKWATPVLQAITGLLVTYLVFVWNGQAERIDKMAGRMDNIETAQSEIKQSIKNQTFVPADWGRMQQTVVDLVKANENTVDGLNRLATQVDNLSNAVSKKQQTKVEVHPTSTIIMQKPDQSRAASPAPRSAPGSGVINRLFH